MLTYLSWFVLLLLGVRLIFGDKPRTAFEVNVTWWMLVIVCVAATYLLTHYIGN